MFFVVFGQFKNRAAGDRVVLLHDALQEIQLVPVHIQLTRKKLSVILNLKKKRERESVYDLTLQGPIAADPKSYFFCVANPISSHS